MPNRGQRKRRPTPACQWRTIVPKPSKVLADKIRPEVKLILCCAQSHVGAESASRIRILLKENIDWTYLIRIAYRHRIMSFVYWGLKTTCPEAVPKTILDQLQDYFQANVRRNLMLTGELLKILNLLEAEDIAVIPFKGPVLAASVYRTLALRQFSDLDILVHKRDVLRSKNMFMSQGYRLWIKMTDALETAYLQSEHAYRFIGDDGRVVVELHWRLMPRYIAFPCDFEQLWENLESISLAGTRVKNLPPEDLLLFLCVHGAKHYWGRLDWICDVAGLIRIHQEINWEQVIEKACSLHSQRRLFLGLLLASNLLEATLPKAVLQKLSADTTVKPLATAVQERLFCREAGLSRTLEWWLFQYKVMDRRQDAVQHIWHRLCAPNDRDRAFLPLPAFLSFFYYLLRPIRLIGEGGLNLCKRLLGRRYHKRYE